MDIAYTSAATLSLESLADLFTRSFEGYFYPGATTAEMLAQRVRTEHIDLWASPVLLVDGEPAGVTLIARRGERAWCGGFGVVKPRRGQGLAHALADELIARARAAGARTLTLEVLTRNEPAIRAYQRAGMAITRRLLICSWRPGEEDAPADRPRLREVAPAELLGRFAAMHPAPAAWQRDLPALLVAGGRRGLALMGAEGPLAYALVAGTTENTRIADLGALSAEAAHTLLIGLQAEAYSLVSVNEPAESPLSAAFYRAGFVVADEQHEMEIAL